jgi:hypothetical protein
MASFYSNSVMENATKTGAIVCRKLMPGTQQLEYEALMFINDIPANVTDEELSHLLDERIKVMNAHECHDIIVRADINSSTNEIWEQYKGLNNDAGKAEGISYATLLPARYI